MKNKYVKTNKIKQHRFDERAKNLSGEQFVVEKYSPKYTF